MVTKTIIIGTRGSDLALWQANYVAGLLQQAGFETSIKIIKTKGDNIQDIGFEKMEGKGFFTGELEKALLDNEIDLAVHSYKDLPTLQPDGLMVAAVTERASPLDVLVIRKDALDPGCRFGLKKNALVGTSSARRKTQIKWLRPDVEVKDLRGNVPTRLNRLGEKKYDAILLAVAGIDRLKLKNREFEFVELPPAFMVPAPAQGALALQVRVGDEQIIDGLKKLHRHDVSEKIRTEREMLSYFDGGCQLPLGSICQKGDSSYQLMVSYSASKDRYPIRIKVDAETTEGLSSKAFHLIKNIKPSRVFVSADEGRYDLLVSSLRSNGFVVEHASCIATSALPEMVLPEAEWVYFNSPASVEHFLEKHKEYASQKKLACAGYGTAEVLSSKGFVVSYSGKSLSPFDAAIGFVTAHKPVQVLIPVSNIGMGTAVKAMEKHTQVFSVEVYETREKKISLSIIPEIAVLTSPSQARSFFAQFPYNDKTHYIAAGLATMECIRLFAPGGNISVSENSHQVSLLEKIYQESSHE